MKRRSIDKLVTVPTLEISVDECERVYCAYWDFRPHFAEVNRRTHYKKLRSRMFRRIFKAMDALKRDEKIHLSDMFSGAYYEVITGHLYNYRLGRGQTLTFYDKGLRCGMQVVDERGAMMIRKPLKE